MLFTPSRWARIDFDSFPSPQTRGACEEKTSNYVIVRDVQPLANPHYSPPHGICSQGMQQLSRFHMLRTSKFFFMSSLDLDFHHSLQKRWSKFSQNSKQQPGCWSRLQSVACPCMQQQPWLELPDPAVTPAPPPPPPRPPCDLEDEFCENFCLDRAAMKNKDSRWHEKSEHRTGKHIHSAQLHTWKRYRREEVEAMKKRRH